MPRQRLAAYDPNHMDILDEPGPRPQAATGDVWLGITPTLRTLASGQALFRQGARTSGIFRLSTGSIRMQRYTSGGSVVTMHTARPGELFAEASLFSPRYHCDAIAQTEASVFIYARAHVLRALNENPSALITFSAGLAQRLQSLRQLMELRQVRSADERVLQYLRVHCDAHGGWAAPGTLKQWAEELALTHEALYRTLARLQRAGLLVRDADKMRLTDSGTR